jgi:hypothetical protein
MNRCLALLTLISLSSPVAAQEPAAEPVVAAYYYRVRWGFQEEFERLFMKNHYPVLMADQKAGVIRNVHLFRPTFHGDGRADWTFLVVITYADWKALGAERDPAVVRGLFPDQETFKREEARRFEILDAHWDVPLTPVRPGK